MSEGTKPTRRERNVWHMEPEDARPDASPEPEPLIAHGSVVGLWVVEHLPVVHPHDHAFYEMALVLSGSGFHVCGDSEEPVHAGTVVIVPPGVVHGYRGCRDMEVYNCFFRAELSDFELLWAARDDALGALFGGGRIRRLEDDHVVIQVERSAFARCVVELEAIRLEDPSERSHAREIGHLLLALDLIARHGQQYGLSPTDRRLATPRVVAAVLEAFDTDLARHWTLADLSNEVYVGSFHLAHEFKRWMGVSPMAYLARSRAKRAGMLLAGTDDSIASIGRAVGWPDPAAFSRQFSKAFGVSPREFRRRRAESPKIEDVPS
jgi:AraC-like DNA-binding protein/quercetin dioxygenase-like cupin family protein